MLYRSPITNSLNPALYSCSVVVKDELDILVQHPEIASRKVPILFFANKMDCPDALSAVKIATGELRVNYQEWL